ncbi:MAG: hypothetical protein AAGC74_10420, partial [Verrucomicrobiota bacterium]
APVFQQQDYLRLDPQARNKQNTRQRPSHIEQTLLGPSDEPLAVLIFTPKPPNLCLGELELL